MEIKLFDQPRLENPVMIIGWPGIGNIGIIVVKTLKNALQAKDLGEIESWDFFYPKRVSIRDGLLVDLEFPGNTFFYQRLEKGDVIFFIGEEQPSEGGGMYARGEKAFRMANLVLDVAQTFGCRRIYTSGACVSLSHHQMKPRVCAIIGSETMRDEVGRYPNTAFMSELWGRGEGEGTITGLNGLMLAVAMKRGMESLCLMGEIPDWLSGAALPYPKASRSVLEVFQEILGVPIPLDALAKLEEQVDGIIEGLFAKFPPETKEEYDQRKRLTCPAGGPVTIQAQVFVDGRSKKGDDEDGGGRAG